MAGGQAEARLLASVLLYLGGEPLNGPEREQSTEEGWRLAAPVTGPGTSSRLPRLNTASSRDRGGQYKNTNEIKRNLCIKMYLNVFFLLNRYKENILIIKIILFCS